MSIKKTWFSYILWLIATGFSILFTYYTVSKTVQCYGIYGYRHIGFQIGYSAIVMAVVVLLCLLIRKLCDKVKLSTVNKWAGRCLHILIFAGITVLFIYTRFYSFIIGELQNQQMTCFYELTKIGSGVEEIEALKNAYPYVSLVPSVFENIYMEVLSTVFLFLGNKIELLGLIQFVFQCVSLGALYLIGWNLQKGFAAWLPALLYAVSPLFASMTGNYGPSNFWLGITLLGMVVIFLLQKLWKNKVTTYILTAIWGVGICIFVFGTKFAVLFYNGPAFIIGAGFRVSAAMLYTELLIWAVVLLVYCIAFWFVKTDSVSLYVIPSALAAGLLLVLQFYENDVVFFLTLFIGFWVSLLGTEGLRLLFTVKPKVLTGQNTECKPIGLPAENVEDSNKSKADDREDFDWTEMKSIMEQKSETTVEEDSVPEDTGVIRVSDILKAANVQETEEEAPAVAEETSVTESAVSEATDKTAMIEDVLPMPKKHVSRSFEYSFEPSDDMMHYDVEVENDDYDYE